MQQSDRFFKAKAAVVGVYLIVCILTTGVVFGVEGDAYDEIGAKIQVVESPLIGGISLSVRNGSDEDWNDVLLKVNNRYSYRRKRVRAQGRITIDMKELLDGELPGVGSAGMAPRLRGLGVTRAPEDLDPRIVDIFCDEGRFRTFLN